MSRPKEAREYVIKGPYPITLVQPQPHWRKLSDDIDEKFFSSNECIPYKTKIGVYIFARKHGNCYTPVYIGKSTNSFGAEVFNPSNRLKYNDAIMEMRGDFSVFFVLPLDIAEDDTWSKDFNIISERRASEIDDVESYLIRKAAKVNPKLKNKNKRKVSEWYITDVSHGHTTLGRKKSPVKEFRQMLGL